MSRPLSDQEGEHFSPSQSRDKTPEQRIFDELIVMSSRLESIETMLRKIVRERKKK